MNAAPFMLPWLSSPKLPSRSVGLGGVAQQRTNGARVSLNAALLNLFAPNGEDLPVSDLRLAVRI